MSEYIHKSHNVTVLLYHIVLPAKYRRAVFDDRIDFILKTICLEIQERYQTDEIFRNFIPTYPTDVFSSRPALPSIDSI